MPHLPRTLRTRLARLCSFLSTPQPTRHSEWRAHAEALESRVLLTTYVVDTAADVIDDADGVTSLREAVLSATQNASVGDAAAGEEDGDRIIFDRTVFGAGPGQVDTIVLTEGALTVRDDLIINGHLPYGVRVQIDANQHRRAISIATDERVILRGLRITNGIGYSDGGGIAVWQSADIEFRDLTITNSEATSRGGAIYIDRNVTGVIRDSVISGNRAVTGGGIHSESTSLLVTGTVIENNRAEREGGGLVNGYNSRMVLGWGSIVRDNHSDLIGGGIFTAGTLATAHVTIVDNEALADGGGVYANNARTTLTATTIEHNRAGTGGGIRAGSGNVVVELRGSTVASNTASIEGGGIHVTRGGSVRLNDSVVEENAALRRGGGLSATGARLVFSSGSTFRDNFTQSTDLGDGGGAIYNGPHSSSAFNGSVVLLDTLVSGNRAGLGSRALGGGLLVDSGLVVFRRTEIRDNTTLGSGGGLAISGGLVRGYDSIIAGNDATDSADQRGQGGGAYIFGNANLRLTNVFVESNMARKHGGGISVRQQGLLQVVDSTFRGNFVEGAPHGSTDDEYGGGGIYQGGGTLLGTPTTVLVNTTLESNRASGTANGPGGGGGLRVEDGLVYVKNSDLTTNSAAGIGGGGAYVTGGTLRLIDVAITDNRLRKSSATGFGTGAGLRVLGGTVEMSGGVISGHEEGYGGIDAEGGRIDLTEVRVFRNTHFSGGGGMRISGATVVNVVNSTFHSNTAYRLGGAIRISDGDVTIVGTTVAGNRSIGAYGTTGLGGGIGVEGGDVTVINSTLSGNTTTGSGGGLLAFSGSSVTLRNTTVVDNVADSDDFDGYGGRSGGGLQIGGADTLRMENSIVAGNHLGDGSAFDIGGTVHANSAFNIVADADTAGGLVNGTDGNITGENGTGVGIEPLADIVDPNRDGNGGPTLTHALVDGSLALDAGSNALAVDENGSPLLTDQRGVGFDRVVGGTVDIGAFERQA